MEQKNKNIIAIVLVALVILAGIIVVCTRGFYKELKYEQGQSIEIYVEQKVDEAKIKEIADEVLGMHNMVQTIEIYEDVVTIKAFSITEEQKNSIVSKVKENYEFTQKAEEITINTVPATRIRDMYKQYVIPFAISGLVVLAYMAIRYHKNGLIKVITTTVAVPTLAELFFLSWMAIVRIPIGKFTPVIVILIYILSILYVIRENEK